VAYESINITIKIAKIHKIFIIQYSTNCVSNRTFFSIRDIFGTIQARVLHTCKAVSLPHRKSHGTAVQQDCRLRNAAQYATMCGLERTQLCRKNAIGIDRKFAKKQRNIEIKYRNVQDATTIARLYFP